MTTRTRVIAALALLPLALSACGGGDATDTASSSSSAPASASASPSKSATPSATSASATPTETPTTEATEAAPAVPDPTEAAAAEPTQAAAAPEQAQGPAAPAAPTVQDYFAAGGGCIADVWNAGDIPYSEALAEQVYAYCDANNLGDWAGDLDPRDPANLGNPEDHAPAAEDPAPPSWEECSALDQNTATSGEIQSCNMAYGYGHY